MKKIISVLLVAAMLAAMLVLAIPAFADGPQLLTVGNNVVGDANRAEYVAGLPQGAIAVDDKSDLIGAMQNGKYYYLTADITFGAGEFASLANNAIVTNVTIDGCGHTVNITDVSLFERTKDITVKNVTFEGSITANDNSYYHILNWKEAQGYTNIENVTASVDFTITNTQKYKTIGVLGLNAVNSTVKNVLNEGNIILKTGSTNMGDVGSLFASANNTTFENVVNKGNITLEKMNISTLIRIGGLVGRARGCKFINCQNSGVISDAIKTEEAYVGGIAAIADGATEFTGCSNFGNITIGHDAVVTALGGIAGALEGDGAYFDSCVNEGEITMARAEAGKGQSAQTKDPSDVGSGIGGILGMSRAKDVYFLNCNNTKNITVSCNGTVGVGGIMGYHYINIAEKNSSVKNSAQALGFEKCTNSGKITDYGKGAMIGGIAGAIRGVINTVIQDCVNSADLKASDDANLSWGTVGGICGLYGSQGGRLTGSNINLEMYLDIYSCTNTGNITNNNHAGGILGRNEEMSSEKLVMTFFNCQNDGNITVSHGNAAGIYAYPNARCFLYMTWCINNGNVTVEGSGKDAGGIIATTGELFHTISITKSKNTGSITGAQNAGGIATKTTQTPQFPECGNVLFEDCVNLGNVTANSESAGIAGGIVGYSKSYVDMFNCINKGAISSAKPESAHGISHNSTLFAADNTAYYLTGCATTTNKDTKGEAKAAGELDTMIAKLTFHCENNPYNLNKAYEESKNYYKVDYTADSWKPLGDAIDQAKTLLEETDADQADMDKIVSDIKAGIKGLKYSNAPLDFSKLEIAIADGVEQGKNWYSFTWLELFIRIRDARELITEKENSENPDHADYQKPLEFRQSAIDLAAEAIYKAIEGLRTKPPIQGTIDVEEKGEWIVEDLRPGNSSSSSSSSSESSSTPEVTEDSEPLLDIDTDIELSCGSAMGTAAVVLVAVTALGSGILLGKKRD